MARPPFQNQHDYAVAQEVQRHDDALHWYGEMTACIAMWGVEDFHAGLVNRCPTCFIGFGAIADAYEQSARAACEQCFGSTFEGGFRAIYYRPALWSDSVTQQNDSKLGVSTTAVGEVQTTSDIVLRDNDYLVRADGTRWRITAPQDSSLTTGFGPRYPIQSRSMFRAQREDRSSPVFLIPITQIALEAEGWSPTMIYPTSYDVVRLP